MTILSQTYYALRMRAKINQILSLCTGALHAFRKDDHFARAPVSLLHTAVDARIDVFNALSSIPSAPLAG